MKDKPLSTDWVHCTCQMLNGKFMKAYDHDDVAEAISRLKEKVIWGRNHGNGDVNSTKAVLEHIDEIFGDFNNG